MLLSHPDFTHAAFADAFHELVASDERARGFADGLVAAGLRIENVIRLCMGAKQCFNPTPQPFVTSASVVEKGRAFLVRGFFERGGEDGGFVHDWGLFAGGSKVSGDICALFEKSHHAYSGFSPEISTRSQALA
jgi:hypothetical protein